MEEEQATARLATGGQRLHALPFPQREDTIVRMGRQEEILLLFRMRQFRQLFPPNPPSPEELRDKDIPF